VYLKTGSFEFEKEKWRKKSHNNLSKYYANQYIVLMHTSKISYNKSDRHIIGRSGSLKDILPLEPEPYIESMHI
jgi:hypothetical protein